MPRAVVRRSRRAALFMDSKFLGAVPGAVCATDQTEEHRMDNRMDLMRGQKKLQNRGPVPEALGSRTDGDKDCSVPPVGPRNDRQMPDEARPNRACMGGSKTILLSPKWTPICH